MEHTLILLKPDAIARGLTGTILARFEVAGLRIADCRHVRPTLRQLEEHYAELRTRNESAFRRTVDSLQGQPFVALHLAGPNAIRKVRALTGPTDPLGAPAGTIRGDFGHDSIAQADAEHRATDNLIHAADSAASVARESAIWFS